MTGQYRQRGMDHGFKVAKDNLVGLIVTCIEHPAVANETFLVSDGEDLSTTALSRRMGDALGRPARLVPFPAALLKNGEAGREAGVVATAVRLVAGGYFEDDELLGWQPPVSVDEALRETARDFTGISNQ